MCQDLDHRLEWQHKYLYEFQEKFAKECKSIRSHIDSYIEHEGQKKKLPLSLETDVQSIEFFLNKILPVKMFTQTTNLMHSVLGHDKAHFQNLVLLEQQQYYELMKQLRLITEQKK